MSSIQIGLDAALILSGAIYGYILSLSLLLSNDRNELAKKLAGAFVLVYAIHITEYVGLVSGLILKAPQFIGITFPLLFLLGPMFLFYAEALNDPDFRLKKKHIAYLVPFLIWQLYFIPFYARGLEEKISFLNQLGSTGISFIPFLYGLSSLIVNFFFIYAAYRKMAEYEAVLVSNYATDRILKLKWTRKFAFGFTVLLALNTLMFVYTKFDNTYLFTMDIVFVIGMIGMIITIGLNAQSQHFEHDPRKVPIQPSKMLSESKYQTSSLDKKKILEIKRSLVQYMEEVKPYLESELKISDLAEQVEIPAHHISQTINQEFGTNFFEFINEYRIESAKRMLENEKFDYFKILAVAIENGFNNKASFNRVFKKYTGVTPSEYRQKRHETVETKESFA